MTGHKHAHISGPDVEARQLHTRLGCRLNFGGREGGEVPFAALHQRRDLGRIGLQRHLRRVAMAWVGFALHAGR